jgi:hypothetical protein
MIADRDSYDLRSTHEFADSHDLDAYFEDDAYMLLDQVPDGQPVKTNVIHYDFTGVPSGIEPTEQQRDSLNQLDLLLEHSVAPDPTTYSIVDNKNLIRSANWIIEEVHRTGSLPIRAKDMVTKFQSYLAHLSQEGKEKYEECVKLEEEIESSYTSLKSNRPETEQRQLLRQDFGMGKQAYYATEDELREIYFRSHLIETFYDRLRDAIKGENNPLDLKELIMDSRHITDKFWPLDGKF